MTSLVDVHVGQGLSETVRKASQGSYELMDGTPVHFTSWYSTDFQDLSATWVTLLDRNVGVYWGFSTGERGEKYRIDPGLTLGLMVQRPLNARSTLTMTATTVMGGRLTEKACTADYGAIGGVQQVNCRLAASVMRPADTLAYLMDQAPPNQVVLTIRYNHEF
jgi:hypothetical protein